MYFDPPINTEVSGCKTTAAHSVRCCAYDRKASFTGALRNRAKSMAYQGYLDDKGILKHDGAEAGDVGGEGLARQVGPGMDV